MDIIWWIKRRREKKEAYEKFGRDAEREAEFVQMDADARKYRALFRLVCQPL